MLSKKGIWSLDRISYKLIRDSLTENKKDKDLYQPSQTKKIQIVNKPGKKVDSIIMA